MHERTLDGSRVHIVRAAAVHGKGRELELRFPLRIPCPLYPIEMEQRGGIGPIVTTYGPDILGRAAPHSDNFRACDIPRVLLGPALAVKMIGSGLLTEGPGIVVSGGVGNERGCQFR